MIFLFLFLLFFIIYCLINKYNNNNKNNNKKYNNKKYKKIIKKIFLTTEQYPRLKILEEYANIIEREIPEFNKEKVKFTRKREDWNNKGMDALFEELKNNDYWIKSWDGKDNWYNFPLIYNNKPVGLAEKICPETIKILKNIPIIRVCGYSLLIPNGKLDIHKDLTGPTYNSMALNLNLIGNNASLFIKYKNKYYEKKHQKYKAIIFNSEKYHYAINYENKNRIILYMDFII